MSNLAASQTRRVSENEVMAVPEPMFTKTWRPVAHRRVIEALDAACGNMELVVQSKEYSVNQNGSRMFGVWHLDYGRSAERGLSLGFRNSIDKSMVVGIVSGTKVFVCDNLAFSGDYLTFHKHTSGLTDKRLYDMAQGAVRGAIPKMLEFDGWQKALKEVAVSRQDRKLLTYDAMTEKVFAPGQFFNFEDALHEELRLIQYAQMSLWAFYGGVTRLMRNASLFQVADRSKKLNQLITKYVGERRKAGEVFPEELN